MTFPNGLNGVKKVFASEILSLIAGIVAIVAAVLGMAALSVIEEGQLTTGAIDSGALAGAGIAGIRSRNNRGLRAEAADAGTVEGLGSGRKG